MRPFTVFVKDRFYNQKLLGAEIGVQRGDNALTMVETLQFKQLYLIDIWERYEIAVKYGEGYKNANFQEFYPIVVERFGKRSDIAILRQSSLEASKKFTNGYFNFVYLDACHGYKEVKEDILAWFLKVKSGGVFGGHDYSSEIYPGLTRAVDEWIQKNNFKFHQEELDWWIVK